MTQARCQKGGERAANQGNLLKVMFMMTNAAQRVINALSRNPADRKDVSESFLGWCIPHHLTPVMEQRPRISHDTVILLNGD